MVAEFEEVEGESEERRKARLGRHQRTKERAVRVFPSLSRFCFSFYLFYYLFFLSLCLMSASDS